MTDFRVKGEGLPGEFITPSMLHSDCLGFLFKFALCVLLRQNIVAQSHSSNGCSQFTLYGVCWDLGLGCLFSQIAIYTEGACENL